MHKFEGLKAFVSSLALMPLAFENIGLDIHLVAHFLTTEALGQDLQRETAMFQCFFYQPWFASTTNTCILFTYLFGNYEYWHAPKCVVYKIHKDS